MCIRHSFRFHLPPFNSAVGGGGGGLSKPDYEEVFGADYNLADDARRRSVSAARPRRSAAVGARVTAAAAAEVPAAVQGVEVEFEAVAPAVFAQLRKSLGISHEEFLTV